MIEGLEYLLENTGHPGLMELRAALEDLLGGASAFGRLVDLQQIKQSIYRLHVEAEGHSSALILKRMDPAVAHRNQLLARRWLPAIGLSEHGPSIRAAAWERAGQCAWHVYEDLGDWPLNAKNPDRKRVEVAIEAIAQLHIRSAGHPILPECRQFAGDLGIRYFTLNLRDAIRGLESLRSPAIDLSIEQADLRNRLLDRLYRLRDEEPRRMQAIERLGKPETLLHGDLWTTNTLVIPAADGLRARLIDWDHVGVGPFSYDLSTFLFRFPPNDRSWMLECYRQFVEQAGWRLPPPNELNLLFDTAERARYANRLIWPTIALLQGDGDWGFVELAAIEGWFEALQPALPGRDKRSKQNA